MQNCADCLFIASLSWPALPSSIAPSSANFSISLSESGLVSFACITSRSLSVVSKYDLSKSRFCSNFISSLSFLLVVHIYLYLLFVLLIYIKLFVYFSEVLYLVCWSQDSYPCRVIYWRYICRYREGPQGFTMSRLRYRVRASLWAAPAPWQTLPLPGFFIFAITLNKE